MHIRKFPIKHTRFGRDECPSKAELQGHIDRIFRDGMCLIVFSNDLDYAQKTVSAPCVHFVEHGDHQQGEPFA